MKTVQQRLKQSTLPLFMLATLFSVQHSAQAHTDRLIIEDGDNSLTKEEARQQKEQWDDTRNLRHKVNSRTRKEFDRVDRAFDTREACEKSLNLNAYWEPKTLRCLDRRTGRQATP